MVLPWIDPIRNHDVSDCSGTRDAHFLIMGTIAMASRRASQSLEFLPSHTAHSPSSIFSIVQSCSLSMCVDRYDEPESFSDPRSEHSTGSQASCDEFCQTRPAKDQHLGFVGRGTPVWSTFIFRGRIARNLKLLDWQAGDSVKVALTHRRRDFGISAMRTLLVSYDGMELRAPASR